MESLESGMPVAGASGAVGSSGTASLEFDFNIPCRYFKSSFARSLSLNNASHHCRSLDFDVNHCRNSGVHFTKQSNNINYNNININSNIEKNECIPLPQQRISRATTNNTNMNSVNSNANAKNEVSSDAAKPPAIPARRPVLTPHSISASNSSSTSSCSSNNSSSGIITLDMQSHQKQPLLAQFRSTAAAVNVGNSNAFAAVAAYGNFNNAINHAQQLQHQQHQYPQLNNKANIGNSSSSSSRNSVSNGVGSQQFRRNVWPKDGLEQDCIVSDEAELESTKLATPFYAVEQQQQMQQPHQQPQQQQQQQTQHPFELNENNISSMEAVIWQNQVDTLQWQLKQMETSCEMYRAVMEEVARFFDRYHTQKQQQQQLRHQQQLQHRHGVEQISRSKSLYHVYAGGGGVGCGSGSEKHAPSRETAAPSYLRARSSTNLVDLKQSPNSAAGKSAMDADEEAHKYTDEPLTNSYTAFKDFTWRRTPKKLNDSRSSTPGDDVDEKLSQEAFRLSRTVHNLLNTSDLTHHRHSLSGVNLGRLSNVSSASAMTLHAPLHNSTSLSITSASTGNSDTAGSGAMTCTPKANTLAAEMLFLRSANMRDSRLSLRSSTDSSVHSTTSSAASSSSKVETDEEPTLFLSPSLMSNKPAQPLTLGSTTEDESGFSSINSFQDIGVPLSSTMLSSAPTNSSTGSINIGNDSRNSTLKAVPPQPPSVGASMHPNNIVGVPLQDIQHRWDASAKTYRNANKIQRFSTLSNEDSAAVLWV